MSQRDYIYPCFAPPPPHGRCTPPPPHYLSPPPPPSTKPPPPPHRTPPPPPRPSATPPPPPPRPIVTPPPPHPITPPPHPVAPPPPSVIPTPPSPPSGNTVIIIVFVSLGGLFFLAFLSAALCCFIKKKKKKQIQETDVVDVTEHIRVQEAIIPGSHGPQAVILSIDDDIRKHEEIRKNETIVGHGHHSKSAVDGPPQEIGGTGTSQTSTNLLDAKPSRQENKDTVL